MWSRPSAADGGQREDCVHRLVAHGMSALMALSAREQRYAASGRWSEVEAAIEYALLAATASSVARLLARLTCACDAQAEAVLRLAAPLLCALCWSWDRYADGAVSTQCYDV